MADKEVVAVHANMPKPLTKRQLEKVRQPYVAAIGRVAWSWNSLQEELRFVYTTLFGSPAFGAACAVWYSTESDLQQRKMLRAAVKGNTRIKLTPEQASDLKDLIKLADDMSQVRNDVIHAPMRIGVSSAGTNIFPDDFFGHQRAKNLKDRNLLKEFAWCDECLRNLREHASLMWRSIVWPDTVPWPGKPRLPAREPSARKAAQTPREAQTRPPRSSPA